MRRWTPSAKVSRSTRMGRVAAISAGTSTKLTCSTRLADHGAPPTLRRISTYSMGFATRPSSMLASSHMDSLSRFSVLSANRIVHSDDLLGTVRDHRSARPRSTALVGSGGSQAGSIGMNAGRRSR